MWIGIAGESAGTWGRFFPCCPGRSCWCLFCLSESFCPEMGLMADLWRIKRQKSIWWMPWRREAMKDVARCEKPRGAASRL